MTMGTGGIFGVPYGSRRKRGGLFDPRLETPDGVEMAPPLGSDFDEEDPKKGLLGYWQGGDKFTWKDAGAGLLAVVGDAFARENDDEGSAVSNLTGGRVKAMAEAKKAAADRALAADAAKMGISPEQFRLMRAGVDIPKQDVPSFIRDAEAFSRLPDEQKASVATFMDMQNPRFTNTPAGTQFIPRTAVPPNAQPMTDEEIRKLGLNPGGPTQRASGGFRR